jgi:uncharacterized protein (DUF362 family)
LESAVIKKNISSYNYRAIFHFLFNRISETGIIEPGQEVVIKPNWVKESHLFRCEDWDYVITHPNVITAVLETVLTLLKGKGRVVITDGPQTDSSFEKIIKIMEPEKWAKLSSRYGVPLDIIDLREEKWISKGDIIFKKVKLKGDPKGSTEVNLIGDESEFYGHEKSIRGYYGADYDMRETNLAHDGYNNKYRLSRTIIESDVFVNIPKMKTHKKAGITCCLKNIVGINTYKNFLPHHNEGTAMEGGDQFPHSNLKSRFEGHMMAKLKKGILQNHRFAPIFVPVKKVGKRIFGNTENIVRSGNWYGNDTLWRTILDLNKILFFSNPDGTMREPLMANRKKYIGIVDGIYAGEGNGPMAPDKKIANALFVGTNPIAIDCACAKFMGFDYMKIPTLVKSFNINKYRFNDYSYHDIVLVDEDAITQKKLKEVIVHHQSVFKPHFGWTGNIES